MHSLTSREFELMRDYIEKECGIALSKDKTYLVESRLSGILAQSGLDSFEQLYYRLLSQKDRKMKEEVIDAITTNETLWFRDKTPWIILEEVLLPKYIEEMREKKRSKVRIWSAGCSTGQEPYSTAMCIDRYLVRNNIRDISPDSFEILGTDISRTVLDIAIAGRYDNISIMRGLDSEYKNRYFTNKGRVWELSKEIRDRVQFGQFNLQSSFITLGKFDIVFCRYVAIYFSSELKRQLFDKIIRVLNLPDGVLFVGNSEIFTDHRDSFIRKEHGKGVYYGVKGHSGV
ncbi:MAG: protein-glutamate O-methyltransferase CheR [Clostridiales bacterium]|nr:protein-glutamate O-methyltransferase CheR [Clostridiales bacterium]